MSNTYQPETAIRLAELVLSMEFVTPKGIEARRLAREVLKSNSDMLTALQLIEHATSPRFEDGAYHENAHELALSAIAKSKNQHATDKTEIASV